MTRTKISCAISLALVGAALAAGTAQAERPDDRAGMLGVGAASSSVAAPTTVPDVVERAVVGAPVESLLALVEELEADLIVIGNRGLNTITGRLLGSVPSDVARKSTSDVLIVHTVR